MLLQDTSIGSPSVLSPFFSSFGVTNSENIDIPQYGSAGYITLNRTAAENTYVTVKAMSDPASTLLNTTLGSVMGSLGAGTTLTSAVSGEYYGKWFTGIPVNFSVNVSPTRISDFSSFGDGLYWLSASRTPSTILTDLATNNIAYSYKTSYVTDAEVIGKVQGEFLHKRASDVLVIPFKNFAASADINFGNTSNTVSNFALAATGYSGTSDINYTFSLTTPANTTVALGTDGKLTLSTANLTGGFNIYEGNSTSTFRDTASLSQAKVVGQISGEFGRGLLGQFYASGTLLADSSMLFVTGQFAATEQSISDYYFAPDESYADGKKLLYSSVLGYTDGTSTYLIQRPFITMSPRDPEKRMTLVQTKQSTGTETSSYGITLAYEPTATDPLSVAGMRVKINDNDTIRNLKIDKTVSNLSGYPQTYNLGLDTNIVNVEHSKLAFALPLPSPVVSPTLVGLENEKVYLHQLSFQQPATLPTVNNNYYYHYDSNYSTKGFGLGEIYYMNSSGTLTKQGILNTTVDATLNFQTSQISDFKLKALGETYGIKMSLEPFSVVTLDSTGTFFLSKPFITGKIYENASGVPVNCPTDLDPCTANVAMVSGQVVGTNADGITGNFVIAGNESNISLGQWAATGVFGATQNTLAYTTKAPVWSFFVKENLVSENSSSRYLSSPFLTTDFSPQRGVTSLTQPDASSKSYLSIYANTDVNAPTEAILNGALDVGSGTEQELYSLNSINKITGESGTFTNTITTESYGSYDVKEINTEWESGTDTYHLYSMPKMFYGSINLTPSSTLTDLKNNSQSYTYTLDTGANNGFVKGEIRSSANMNTSYPITSATGSATVNFGAQTVSDVALKLKSNTAYEVNVKTGAGMSYLGQNGSFYFNANSIDTDVTNSNWRIDPTGTNLEFPLNHGGGGGFYLSGQVAGEFGRGLMGGFAGYMSYNDDADWLLIQGIYGMKQNWNDYYFTGRQLSDTSQYNYQYLYSMTPFKTVSGNESVIFKPFFTLAPLSFGSQNDILSIPQMSTDGTQNSTGFLDMHVGNTTNHIVGLQIDDGTAGTPPIDKSLNISVNTPSGTGTFVLNNTSTEGVVKYGWNEITGISYNDMSVGGKLYFVEIIQTPTAAELGTLASNSTTYTYHYDTNTEPSKGFIVGQIAKNNDKEMISQGTINAQVNFATNRVDNLTIQADSANYRLNLDGSNATLSNQGSFIMNNISASFCQLSNCTALTADHGIIAGQLIGSGSDAAKGIAGTFNAHRLDENWTTSGVFGVKKQ